VKRGRRLRKSVNGRGSRNSTKSVKSYRRSKKSERRLCKRSAIVVKRSATNANKNASKQKLSICSSKKVKKWPKSPAVQSSNAAKAWNLRLVFAIKPPHGTATTKIKCAPKVSCQHRSLSRKATNHPPIFQPPLPQDPPTVAPHEHSHPPQLAPTHPAAATTRQTIAAVVCPGTDANTPCATLVLSAKHGELDSEAVTAIAQIEIGIVIGTEIEEELIVSQIGGEALVEVKKVRSWNADNNHHHLATAVAIPTVRDETPRGVRHDGLYEIDHGPDLLHDDTGRGSTVLRHAVVLKALAIVIGRETANETEIAEVAVRRVSTGTFLAAEPAQRRAERQLDGQVVELQRGRRNVSVM
jgi:hypothetical protein